MKVRFLGAAGEVTGSSFLLTSGGRRLLVDMGMFQGAGSSGKNRNQDLIAEGCEAVVLTHAHLDHCGRLPLLSSLGFIGKVFANKPTMDLAYLVLKDAAKVSGLNAREEGIKALYNEDSVEQLMGRFEVVDYQKWREIGEGLRFRLWDAGHIMGSSSVEIESEGRKIVFSGDLGNTPSRIVRETDAPLEAEVVIMESTYGDKSHPERGEEIEKLVTLCKEIEGSGGTLLLPAFSLDRTQELLLLFDHLKREGRVSNGLTVYLDSPMGNKATIIYEKYPQLFNQELSSQRKWDDPFDFPGLVLVENGQKSRKVDEMSIAKVIIAGSGMMTGGRIVSHSKKWLPDSKTIVLITGYQAVGTLGRELLEGKKEVIIDGSVVTVAAKIVEVSSMSAHADQKQLMDWLKAIKGVKQVILVHGEDGARMVFKERIERELGLSVVLPVLREEIEI